MAANTRRDEGSLEDRGERRGVTKPGVTYWHGRPRSLEARFVGRGDELDKLADAFKADRVVVISGGAGVGKSQLAAEYAHRYGGDAGFWTAAGPTVTQTLAALARDLGIAEGNRTQEEVAAEVQRQLTNLPPETLWVVDNLGNADLVNQLASVTGRIQLLVTTRDDRPRSTGMVFQPLGALATAAAVDLLLPPGAQSNLDREDPRLREIVEAVGRLPMALEMLAARLSEYGESPGTLLNELRRAPTPVELAAFQRVAEGTIPRAEGVFATITGTLKRLPRKVRQQLAPLGYVADAPISNPLLAALTDLEGEEINRLVEECRRHSVLSISDGQVVVHALTVAAIAAANRPRLKDKLFRRTKHPPLAILDRATARIDVALATDRIALGDELPHYRKFLDRAREIAGVDNTTALNFANNLADAYHAVGRYEEAIALNQETLKIREQVQGPEHPDTLSSRNNLAAAYHAIGHYEQAIELHQETLKITERVLGPGHPHTLSSRNNLATAYPAVGRNEEAIELHQETLKMN
ncbi:MAG: tetratricopeptide repeat protein, partial [Dehalococcoidia bacterium]